MHIRYWRLTVTSAVDVHSWHTALLASMMLYHLLIQACAIRDSPSRLSIAQVSPYREPQSASYEGAPGARAQAWQ